jgi:DNA invertase Pin-like site-specific DNA recombinase
MKRAIAYIRVSSEEQAQSGFGLQSQEAAIRAYADAAGYRVRRVYREIGSAIGKTAAERPELQRALKHARRNNWPLIIPSLDRLSRNSEEIETIVGKSGVTIIDVKNGPHRDPIVIKTEAARVAEETKMLSERTKEGLRRAKQQGKIFGNPRNLRQAQKMGAEATRRNAQKRDAEIAPIILGARQSPPSEIADLLNRAGYRTPRGKAWSAVNLRRVIRRIDCDAEAKQRRAQENSQNPNWGLF